MLFGLAEWIGKKDFVRIKCYNDLESEHLVLFWSSLAINLVLTTVFVYHLLRKESKINKKTSKTIDF